MSMLLWRPVALTNTTYGGMYVFPVLVVPWKFVARISESASKSIFNGTICFDIFELVMLMVFTSLPEFLIFSLIFSKSWSFPKNFKKQTKYHLIMQTDKICGFIRVKISNILLFTLLPFGSHLTTRDSFFFGELSFKVENSHFLFLELEVSSSYISSSDWTWVLTLSSSVLSFSSSSELL